jgi:polyhydroxybutyrate depolymerase
MMPSSLHIAGLTGFEPPRNVCSFVGERRRTLCCVIAVGLALAWLSAGADVTGAAAVDCGAPIRWSTVTVESRCHHLVLAGRDRTYRVYSPPRLNAPSSLLFALHGGGGNGAGMEQLLTGRLNRLADANNFIVVYPDGIGRGWNDGRHDLRARAATDDVDDIGFLKAVIDAVDRDHHVDRRRVYATGMSNGGMMSYRLACDASDVFAAVAPVAATMSVELAARCTPLSPIPIAIVSGTSDPIMPWAGGAIQILFSQRGQVIPVDESFRRWSSMDQCGAASAGPTIDRQPDDGTQVIVHDATHCAGGIAVRLYEVRGGGHTWPGGSPYLTERLVGKVSREIDASTEIWEFVSRFSRPAAGRR